MMEVSGICIGPWVGQLVVRGREVRLGPLEHRLLIFLMRNANTLLSKEAIAAETWAGRNEEGKTNRGYLVSMHIRRIRQAIEEDSEVPRLIVNRYGLGYMFVDHARGIQHRVEEKKDSFSLELDRERNEVRIRGREIHLTTSESHLLECLLNSAGNVCSDALLTKLLWGAKKDTQTDIPSRHRLASIMHNLCDKLGDTARRALIERVWKVGYRYVGH